MTQTATMIDTVGANSTNVPLDTAYVGAYVTGLGSVPWTPGDIARFSNSRVVLIDQAAGPRVPVSLYHVQDIEQGAYTPGQAADEVAQRVAAGIQWTTGYGTDSTLAAYAADVQAHGSGIWIGHVSCWLADWSLDEEEAAAKIGTQIHGMTCVAVQWASPSSNPNTLLPGTSRTLAEMNCDLSVVDATWNPAVSNQPRPTPPPPVKTYSGLLVTVDGTGNFGARQVTSADDVNWH